MNPTDEALPVRKPYPGKSFSMLAEKGVKYVP